MIYTRKVIHNFLRKITPICCHAHRVNRAWQEAEIWFRGRLTIEPQTFCSLKEIEQKTMKMQQNNQQCVILTQSRERNHQNVDENSMLYTDYRWGVSSDSHSHK